MSTGSSVSAGSRQTSQPRHESKLRVLIADDEQLSRDYLRRFLIEEPGIEIVAECCNGIEAAKSIRENQLDIAFLDIRMPELDAFGLLEMLNDVPLPAIVLVTAHDQFALRAFEIDAVDYLLKPFDRERFRTALKRARSRLRSEPTRAERPARGVDVQPLERFFVSVSGQIALIKTREVHYISAADNYVELHVGNKCHLLRRTISTLAEKLQGQFVRISRSLLVNFDYVKEIRGKSNGDYLVVLENGTSLGGTRNYRECLKDIAKAAAGGVEADPQRLPIRN